MRQSVIESLEHWSEFTLADGTVLLLKTTFPTAIRQSGHDNNGFPIYVIENPQLLVHVKSCKDELKATKQ
jgi:hypothetical protein